ncbi:MAG: inositol monophosphatase family protein [Pseudomonadota bacterium]
MNATLHAEVALLLQDAAERFVVPRFQRLAAGDAAEKSPGEWVTIVDREVEAMLTPALQALRPGARVVGKEACAEQPRLLDTVGEGEVWLVDPLDGTGNFMAGRPEVAVLVALLREGETVAGWLLDPLRGTLCTAERGAGAWRGGQRLQAVATAAANGLRGIVKTRFLPPDLKPRMLQRAAALREMQAGVNSAGVEYPQIVAGQSDFALYWRTLPWDHAAGVLFLQEAGGHAARPDGSAYRPAEQREGLLAAADRETWNAARALLGL